MKSTTHADPRNTTTNPENIYTDIDFPWITYHGTRPKTNPHGPRSIWWVHDDKKSEKTGPFYTLKKAKDFVHGNILPPPFQTQPINNGNVAPEPETTQEKSQLTFADILREEVIPETAEATDQLIEFSCPHCGKGIIGLLARK